jgi:hypothetical protein
MTLTPQEWTALIAATTELAGFHRGDIVRTPQGKADRVVTSLRPANAPHHPQDVVVTRALREGKPFGPEKASRPDDLIHISVDQGSHEL